MAAFTLKKVNSLVFASTLGMVATLATGMRSQAITVAGDPADYIVSPGTGFDGVVQIQLNRIDTSVNCTGSLLPTGLHILTAAHCLTGNNGTFNTESGLAFFDLPTERIGIPVAEFFIHPLWNGKFAKANDVAVLQLASEAPAEAERYDLYRQIDELNQLSVLVGYGLSGNGNEGAVFSDGRKRSGLNTYDALGDIFAPVFEILAKVPIFEVLGDEVTPGTLLVYDFDNGLPANDAFGLGFGISDLGLGLDEVSTASGDSGGPTFINGLIAGISSFGFGIPIQGFGDIDEQFSNESFGEFDFDTRISTYASWVDSAVAGNQPSATVPEPSTVLGSLFAFGAFAAGSQLKRKQKQKARPSARAETSSE